MTADEALLRSWELGMGDDGWTEAVMDEADQLLPILVEAGYVEVDEANNTWAYTDAGVARYDELTVVEDEVDGGTT
jgi:hypothetical protein